MIRRDDCLAICRANIAAAAMGHRMGEEWTRMEGLWFAYCERCGLRVIVNADEDRVFGAGVRVPCEHDNQERG